MKHTRPSFTIGKSNAFVLMALFSFPLFMDCKAQTSGVTTYSDKGTKLLLCNAAIGMISGAIGVAVNDRDARLKDILIRGAAQGALGGSIVHMGKNRINSFAKSGNTGDYWKSKLIFSVGNSIIENAANNKRFYESIRVEYLFARIEFDIVSKRMGLGINYSELLANSVARTFERRHYDIDWAKSLSYGILISSDQKSKILNRQGTRGHNSIFSGIAISSKYKGEDLYYKILAHEIIHYYQDHQFGLYTHWGENHINIPLFEKLRGNDGGDTRFYYFGELVAPIFHDLALYPITSSVAKSKGDYYSNIFENEARFYSRGK